jgi:predicted Zn-dependent protease
MKRAVLILGGLTLCLSGLAAYLHHRAEPPKPGPSILEQALYAQATGDLDRARDLMKLHSEACPSDWGSKLHYASLCVDTGRTAEASRILQEIESKKLAVAQCAILRSRMACRSGQQDLAASVLSAAALELPKSAILWRELGLMHHAQGRGVEALAACQRSLALDPAQEDLSRLVAELSVSAATGDLPRGKSRGGPQVAAPQTPVIRIPGAITVPDPTDHLPNPDRGRPQRGPR